MLQFRAVKVECSGSCFHSTARKKAAHPDECKKSWATGVLVWRDTYNRVTALERSLGLSSGLGMADRKDGGEVRWGDLQIFPHWGDSQLPEGGKQDPREDRKRNCHVFVLGLSKQIPRSP